MKLVEGCRETPISFGEGRRLVGNAVISVCREAGLVNQSSMFGKHGERMISPTRIGLEVYSKLMASVSGVEQSNPADPRAGG
jgi:hypothetical protein